MKKTFKRISWKTRYESAQNQCEQLETELSDARTALDAKTTELTLLQTQLGDVTMRYDLVSRILAAPPPKNDGLNQFYALLENDFMAFAKAASAVAVPGTQALHTLQSIGRELEMLVGQPDVRKRSLVAIVGGFSSGKSAFINSFIQDDTIRLSVGIQPVTVIPSYVFATDTGQQTIRGYSANHGHIELDAALYQGFSHAFIDAFNFDLRSLMPFVCLGVKMDTACFGNLCFIDTPGYNPPASNEYSNKDKNTAVAFARQADALIWLIGLDVNGTVPQSDLEFIHAIARENQPIYVVLNKADLRAEEQVADIMEEVQAVLDDEGLEVQGICAYSAVQRRTLQYEKLELMDYFAQINQASDVCHQLFQRLDEVFDTCGKAIQVAIRRIQQHKKTVNSLKLDAMETGGDDLLEKMGKTIEKMEVDADVKPLEQLLKKSRGLHQAFVDSLKMTASEFVGAVSSGKVIVAGAANGTAKMPGLLKDMQDEKVLDATPEKISKKKPRIKLKIKPKKPITPKKTEKSVVRPEPWPLIFQHLFKTDNSRS